MAKEEPSRFHGTSFLEALSRVMAPAQEVARKIAAMPSIDPAVLDELRMMATLPALESARKLDGQIDQIGKNLQAMSPLAIEMPKRTEDYILEAQYDTIEVMREMDSLLQQSLEIQDKQFEALKDVQESFGLQTRLTYCVLGVALLGVVATVLIAFLT